MAYSTVFEFGTFQYVPLAFQIDKVREDIDKDKGHGKAKLDTPPSGGTAKVDD
ncbi:hypothetical protein LCGC14_2511220 [marine sediment metagenome]|uniref:Uncharacterized protein n=1 Tax=marine sediment metagenome TaxID=412755 RepID=A0A0F9BLZ0_9ZZZZ